MLYEYSGGQKKDCITYEKVDKYTNNVFFVYVSCIEDDFELKQTCSNNLCKINLLKHLIMLNKFRNGKNAQFYQKKKGTKCLTKNAVNYFKFHISTVILHTC